MKGATGQKETSPRKATKKKSRAGASAEASRYINRELSWLEFNQRVLDEARDETVPLLERLKFLAISASNLDEFFMVRVGGLQMLAQQSNPKDDPSGMSPAEQLEAIGSRARQMAEDQYECFNVELEPQLAAAGILRLQSEHLSERQAHVVQQFFDDEVFSVLTPVAVASADDLPLLANQTMNLCVRLKPVDDEGRKPRFAIIPCGRSVPRVITLPAESGYSYALLEDVVGTFVGRFFPGEEVVECIPFRITRNAELSLREDMASDLLAEMQEVLEGRKQNPCVRLELFEQSTKTLRSFLEQVLPVDGEDVYSISGPLSLSAFMPLTDLQAFDDLKYEPWSPQQVPEVEPGKSMLEIISRRDLLLYHPYESFEPVVRLVEEAANDPDVLAIKQTLYRTSRNSAIVAALKRAAENGKHVTAIVELKARFDEERNIEWARNLEQAEVQVIYGVKGLKTHAKLCIIVRREPHGIRRYVHFGTGNYNESTARLYSDASYMTCDEELGADAISFFNAITGYSQPQNFRKIAAAPIWLRQKLVEMIEIETERKRQGQDAKIWIKLNSLVDPEIIDALYAASGAGVEIKLNIRGICCLRPGVPDLSENITVDSIIDRYLEHSRILYFYHGGDERVFISSADWMPRNLNRRVELLVPVEDPACRKRLISFLDAYFHDTVKSRRLLSDGSYARVRPSDDTKVLRSQQALYRRACEAVKHAHESKPTVFEPHRAPARDS